MITRVSRLLILLVVLLLVMIFFIVPLVPDPFYGSVFILVLFSFAIIVTAVVSRAFFEKNV